MSGEREVRVQRVEEILLRDFPGELGAVDDLRSIERDLARLAEAEEALKVLANRDSWIVTPSSLADGRYGFVSPPDSVYATPWGFADAALAARPVSAEGDTQ